jgi:hypothetical protein
MFTWQPIMTAKRDGTVILSDQGSCRWVTWACNGKNNDGAWYLCEVNGYIPSCVDWGIETSQLDSPAPTRWVPFPTETTESY